MKRKLYVFRIGMFLLPLTFFVIAEFSQERMNHGYIPPGLSFKEEKYRLDETAKELKLYPAKIVYLLGWNKEGTKKITVLKRLRKSKQYLIKKYKISPERIITGYEGSAPAGIRMHIFVVGKDAPSPFTK